MRKSDRLFQLANILRAHQPITAKELAEKLSVSERTIYRYMDDLSVSGIPAYGEAGVGYRLSNGFELPPLQLTQEEFEALIISLNLLSSWTGAELKQSSLSLLSKIEAGLPDLGKYDLHKTVRVPGKHLRSVDFSLWDQLHKAISSKQWIYLSYTSLIGSRSKRIVYPLGLFYWGGKWTLGGWCGLKQDYRDFRIDRIESLDLEVPQRELPTNVSLSDYIEVQKSSSLQNTTDTMLSGV
ncbi:helix-turn-helix transcriptional regulator [Microbulbifer sp. DLAB2-AA]|uniref:helix-turn-helix transcriptional regulator n=1 Tax=Microbulbifer sp. DLAB2-AA TaxID=3243394 RepID=UPI0040397E62